MLDINDFSKKQIVCFSPARGDKMSYRNSNIIIKDAEGNIKFQNTCYRIFSIIVIGDCSITTGLIQRARKFGFSICFMTYSFRFYEVICNGLEGNNHLHAKQYAYNQTEIGRVLILNKIMNQRNALNMIRRKSEYVKEGISMLDSYIDRLSSERGMARDTILGIEGNAAKVYFPRIFDTINWKSRKPRIKFDYINSLLDIGYTVLFNFLDCLLHIYDFDVYQGVLHTSFYMRKSLTCDMMEPFRCIIDWRVRKGIHLGQFKKEDFMEIDHQWQLEYKKSAQYTSIFLEDILKNKDSIFLYVRSYYRAFMKDKSIENYPIYDISEERVYLPIEAEDEYGYN